jgi:hypothetical protein
VTGRIAFSPAAMEEVAADLEVQADHLDAVATDVGDAIAAYRASCGEFVATLPDHPSFIAAQGELLRGVSANVLLLAAAAEEADGQGIDLRALLATGVHLTGNAARVSGGHDAVVALLRASVHGTRDVRAWRTQLGLVSRYGAQAMPDIAAIRREVAGGTAMKRSQIRPIQLERYRQLKRQRVELHRTRTSARTGLRTNAPVTRLGTSVGRFMNDTRAGRALTTGTRRLGVAGGIISVADTAAAIAEGDTERAVTSGLAAVGTGLMLTPNPITFGAGAAITAGVLVYENWDTITDWGGAVADGAGDVYDGVKDFIGGLF